MGVKVAIVGSGMMGRGIAACIAAGGPHEVRLFDSNAAVLPEAVQKAQDLVEFMAANGVAAAERGTVVAKMSLEEAVRDTSFVFEAIVENMDAKRALFSQLAALTGPDTVLCTNTSSLSVSGIAAGCKAAGAERVVAAHFIGPAHLVPLVEICPGELAAAAAPGLEPGQTPAERVRRFLVSVGKKPVVLKKEIDGFIAARLQAALYREALHIVQSGAADCEAVDGAVFNGFGRRLNQIGPFLQADFAGVDLTQNTHATFFPQLGGYQRDLRADELVPQGRLGVKALKGHYDWTEAGVKEVAQRRDAELLRRLQADRAQAKRSKL